MFKDVEVEKRDDKVTIKITKVYDSMEAFKDLDKSDYYGYLYSLALHNKDEFETFILDGIKNGTLKP